MALQPGDTLLNGQYRILQLLGHGGFGFIYHAQNTHPGEEVAVKEPIPGLVGDEAILKRFLAEAKATLEAGLLAHGGSSPHCRPGVRGAGIRPRAGRRPLRSEAS